MADAARGSGPVTEPERTARLHVAIEAIYHAALHPADWPDALALIADCTGDVGAVLLWSKGDGSFGTITSPGLADAQAVYVEKWSHRDVRAQRAMEFGYWRADEVITDYDAISPEEMAVEPFYTEFLASFGLKWCVAVGVAFEDAVFRAGLTIQRAAGRDHFDVHERETVRVLGRHVEKSLRLGRELIDRRTLTETLADVLRRLDVAVFALDHETNVIFLNEAAKLLPDGVVQLQSNRLVVFKDSRKVDLRGALDRIVGATRDAAWPVAPILASARDGQQVVVYVLPVVASGGMADAILRTAKMLVVVLPHPRGAGLDPLLLRDVFGLTPAEARLAAIIGGGASRTEAARQLQVSGETVKSTLSRVFGKTGTSRQSELAAFLGGIGFRS